MRIKKIKVIKEEVVVEVSQRFDGGNFNGDIKSTPAPSFLKTIIELKPFVIDMCELAKNSDIEICGISLSYHGEIETQAAVITFRKRLSEGNASITINSPMKYVEAIGDNEESSQLMPEAMGILMDKITKEAVKYVKGFREQTNLFK